MQAMRRAINAYGMASETLAPAQQIVLLYEGAIRRIKEARSAIEARRVNERWTAVQKATGIIEGLQSCLDHERGGEIAENLDRLYTHLAFRLQQINLTDDATICDELIARLDQLRGSWAQLAAGATQSMPPVASGAVGLAKPAADHARTVTI
jgi:flagellar secretion chaperone FliS